MAGVKGKSGGRRPNTGGARPGAGRPRERVIPLPVIEAVIAKPAVKKKPSKPQSKFAAQPAPATTVNPHVEAKVKTGVVGIAPVPLNPPMTLAEANLCRNDPLEFLRAVWAGRQDASPTQIRAAAAALPFLHKKLGEGGKKDQTQKAAEKVASRFAPVAPPRLIASNDK